MHSSALGAAARMSLRSFSSAARLSLLKSARYSSIVCGLAAADPFRILHLYLCEFLSAYSRTSRPGYARFQRASFQSPAKRTAFWVRTLPGCQLREPRKANGIPGTHASRVPASGAGKENGILGTHTASVPLPEFCKER